MGTSHTTMEVLMYPITVYKTKRPWWCRPWQAEPTDKQIDHKNWKKAVTAFTKQGAERKAVERYMQTAGRLMLDDRISAVYKTEPVPLHRAHKVRRQM